jgi:hypothetical protein
MVPVREGLKGDEACSWGGIDHFRQWDAFEGAVESRPAGHTMDVKSDLTVIEGEKVIETQRPWIVDQTFNGEMPLVHIR